MRREWNTFTGNESLLPARYIPLTGWFMGGISAVVFWAGSLFAPVSLALALALIAGLFASGITHERGFASLCDAMGGGWTREDVLRILGDSRIGSYGAAGLVLFLLLEFQLLLALPEKLIPWLLLAGHTLGRFFILPIMYSLKPAFESEEPAAAPTRTDLTIAFLLAIAPTLITANQLPLLMLTPVFGLIIVRAFSRWLRNRIGGYTPAGLSTAHLAARICMYMTALISFRFFARKNLIQWIF